MISDKKQVGDGAFLFLCCEAVNGIVCSYGLAISLDDVFGHPPEGVRSLIELVKTA